MGVVRDLLASNHIDSKGLSDHRVAQILRRTPVSAQPRRVRLTSPGQATKEKVRVWVVRNAAYWVQASESAIDAYLSGKPCAVPAHQPPRNGETNTARSMMTARSETVNRPYRVSELPMLSKPNSNGFPSARLLADEQRLHDWFVRLDALDRRRHYSVAEIRAATGVPATRLQLVMYRLGWRRRPTPNGFTIPLFQGPFAQVEQREHDAFDRLLGRFKGVPA